MIVRPLALSLIALLCSTVVSARQTILPAAKESIQPEDSISFVVQPPVTGKKFMVAAPHPLATAAAEYVLKNGGTAVDAAIAAGAMLTLVEPYASGIGGGGFMLAYDAKTKKTTAFDGRETAPLATKPTLFLDAKGQPLEFYKAVGGGKSVGVPGLVAMFEQAHSQFGRTKWYDLWRLTAEQAKAGFRVTPQLARLIAADPLLDRFPETAAYFKPNGKPLEAGWLLQNPALAETMMGIAINGAKAFYADDVSDAILKAVRQNPVSAGGMAMQDLIDYKAVTRQALCGTYRTYTICGAPPPSGGALVTLQALKMLERFPLQKTNPNSAEGIHVVTEALRLAYADRGAYIGDPAFAPTGVNMTAMLTPAYVTARSALIRPTSSVGTAKAGVLPGQKSAMNAVTQYEPPSTSQISVVDSMGNAVSLTQSIENVFGSRLMAGGFLLNNQLTDFNFIPTENGKMTANAAAPNKRPRSSMSPTLVFETKTGNLRYVLGSPGGARITPYVVKTLVSVLDWGLPLDTAINNGNFSNRNGETELEQGRFTPAIIADLKKRGQPQVIEANLTSGINAIEIRPDGVLVGVTDPRRGGEVRGN